MEAVYPRDCAVGDAQDARATEEGQEGSSHDGSDHPLPPLGARAPAVRDCDQKLDREWDSTGGGVRLQAEHTLAQHRYARVIRQGSDPDKPTDEVDGAKGRRDASAPLVFIGRGGEEPEGEVVIIHHRGGDSSVATTEGFSLEERMQLVGPRRDSGDRAGGEAGGDVLDRGVRAAEGGPPERPAPRPVRGVAAKAADVAPRLGNRPSRPYVCRLME